MGREIISVHVGQAGCELATSVWQLYGAEHKINNSGIRSTATTTTPTTNLFNSSNDTLTTSTPVDDDLCTCFYEETLSGRHVPRSVLVDSEPTVVDKIRQSNQKDLFHPSSIINGNEDAASNFSRAYFCQDTNGLLMETLLEQIRKQVENCDNLQGFFVLHSFGGGTGSGLSSRLMETLSKDFTKKTKFSFAIYPSPKISPIIVEPYNAVHMTHHMLDNADCSFIYDNEAIFDICHDRLGVERPTYGNLNKLIAQVLSSITASLRFSGCLNVDLNEFQTNLVPYPRIHFPLTSLSPFVPPTKVQHERLSARQLTSDVFEAHCQMVKCSPLQHQFMSCCMLYRGDFTPKDVNSAIQFLRGTRKLSFVDWCPTGFKVGINSRSPITLPDSDQGYSQRALCMLSNNTAVVEAWKGLLNKFDLMYNKRAFVHWFVCEGMEEGEFGEARMNLATLEKDYEEVSRESEDISSSKKLDRFEELEV